MAKAMVTAGAKVVICGRSQASLDNLKTHFDPWPSDQILPIVCDVVVPFLLVLVAEVLVVAKTTQSLPTK
jgi:NADP-dependent 3-hydroxy acid dehydrogenase YdfG